MMNLDYSFELKYVVILKLFLFSAYNTLKYVLFIMLNIFHNSTCKQEMNRMYFKVYLELVSCKNAGIFTQKKPIYTLIE
ncbi:hypothetical protein COL26_13835 [Bacillus thuringiensis]|uniref:Uncharacterized protein n=1 Tax=Bacillus thuringiensis TaxID=1428 RepID=A0ABD6S2F8_BACTU|nr:hypothetical protein CN495_17850 [Bacillus thuringiensis]PEU80088.1 hypothetical protein CN411_25355 [Bacillus thuringiensis]PEY73966.1 hypothetical protein CN355_08180 [Bacillus thuringiensis]PFH96879.1 hypothetical protein COI79_34365 [Bacillus thuringiensis]PFW42411.1 hypothetical protein COL26_13835 [Bacillus thuringiensis]